MGYYPPRAQWATTASTTMGTDQPNNNPRLLPQPRRLECIHSSFADVADKLSRLRLPRASALVTDLGCSSMQVNDPSRGFTWKADGPLNMRMDAAVAAAEDDNAMQTRTTPPTRPHKDDDHDHRRRPAGEIKRDRPCGHPTR
jgi:hypothetical protein